MATSVKLESSNRMEDVNDVSKNFRGVDVKSHCLSSQNSTTLRINRDSPNESYAGTTIKKKSLSENRTINKITSIDVPCAASESTRLLQENNPRESKRNLDERQVERKIDSSMCKELIIPLEKIDLNTFQSRNSATSKSENTITLLYIGNEEQAPTGDSNSLQRVPKGSSNFKVNSVVELDLKKVKKELPDISSSSFNLESPIVAGHGNGISMKVVESDPFEARGYSQCEEIIVISDDESYLDFKSSQDVRVKKEPIDDYDEDLKNIFGTESESVVSYSTAYSYFGERSVQHESVEDIKAFVRSTEKNHHKTTERNDRSSTERDGRGSAEGNSRGSTERDGRGSAEGNSRGSTERNALRHSRLNSSEISVVREIESDDDNLNSAVNFSESACGSRVESDTSRQAPRKTLFTDPKPMSYRPRKLRSRDEGFVGKERNSKKRSLKNADAPVKKPPTVPQSGNNKLKSFKIPRLSESGRRASSSETGAAAGNDQGVKEATPKKKPPVKSRSDKFGSRMGFLMNQEVIVPKRRNNVESVSPMKKTRLEHQDSCRPQQNSTPSDLPRSHGGLMSQVVGDRGMAKSADMMRSRPAFSTQCNGASQTDFRLQPIAGRSEGGAKPMTAIPQHVNSKDPRLKAHPTPSPAATNRAAEANTCFPEPRGQPSRELGRETAASESILDVSSNGMLKTLLNLKASWLKEQMLIKNPPPDVVKGAKELPLSFSSYDAYVAAFWPLALLEFWEVLFVESKPIHENSGAAQKFYFSVNTFHAKGDFVHLDCVSAVNDKLCYPPREGTFAILELKDGSGRLVPCFGYVASHRVLPVNPKVLGTPAWTKLPPEWRAGAKNWSFQVQVRRKITSLQMTALMKGFGICYMRSKLRLLDALRELRRSPLLQDILCPSPRTFFIDYRESSPTRDYTTCQQRAINGISNNVVSARDETRIFLLQGPPGTGKTHTIVGILEKILLSSRRSSRKILACSASNAAIDEIGCRIIELNSKRSTSPIKFVRVGLENQIHPKILPFFLDQMAGEMLSRHNDREHGERNKKMKALEDEIRKARSAAQTDASKGDHLKYLEDMLGSLRALARGDHAALTACKTNILRDCHVVLSTLNSCGHSILLRTHGRGEVRYSCCIVDESTQCTELDILQPLVFGIRKLVLVGDHRQLPATVSSKLACQYKFDRSMFERFHLYFERRGSSSPVFVLNEQFRMHSEICAFPSAYFYQGQLVTAPIVNVAHDPFPFRHYVLLDLLVSQESGSCSSKANHAEASAIISIVNYLLQELKTKETIGIITPYQGQKRLYMSSLSHHPGFREVEVNTVDSFQGREKDVIILSCVRANGQSGGIGFLASQKRLNVSITRARKCLIICAHTASLAKDPDWKALIDNAKKRKLYFPISSAKDVPYVFKALLRKPLSEMNAPRSGRVQSNNRTTFIK